MKRRTGPLIAGIVFIVIGAGALLDALDWWDLEIDRLWAALLIGVGIAVIFGGSQGHAPRD